MKIKIKKFKILVPLFKIIIKKLFLQSKRGIIFLFIIYFLRNIKGKDIDNIQNQINELKKKHLEHNENLIKQKEGEIYKFINSL